MDDVLKTIADKIDRDAFMGTACTNTTAEAKPFTIRDLWLARFAMHGFTIKDKSLLPEHCIEFEAKDPHTILWFNVETGKLYKWDAAAIAREEWPTAYEFEWPKTTFQHKWDASAFCNTPGA